MRDNHEYFFPDIKLLFSMRTVIIKVTTMSVHLILYAQPNRIILQKKFTAEIFNTLPSTFQMLCTLPTNMQQVTLFTNYENTPIFFFSLMQRVLWFFFKYTFVDLFIFLCHFIIEIHWFSLVVRNKLSIINLRLSCLRIKYSKCRFSNSSRTKLSSLRSAFFSERKLEHIPKRSFTPKQK